MDVVDHVVASEALIFEKQIESIRKKMHKRELAPKGACHYCAEPFEVDDNRIFCDHDCRDDNLKYKKRA